MDAWGEFEALNALANYARENPDSTFPEFSGEAAQFEAVALGHPLLPDETCVRNDVRFNDGTRFYIISGSNMSGKSSLLRAIGLNAVLAFAGAPVRAQVLQLSELSVCASLSVVDSLLNGKSLAEVWTGYAKRFSWPETRRRCSFLLMRSSAEPILATGVRLPTR